MYNQQYDKMARYYEALYRYAEQAPLFKDYIHRCLDEDIDLEEYIWRYRSAELRAFIKKEFPDVDPDIYQKQ